MFKAPEVFACEMLRDNNHDCHATVEAVVKAAVANIIPAYYATQTIEFVYKRTTLAVLETMFEKGGIRYHCTNKMVLAD